MQAQVTKEKAKGARAQTHSARVAGGGDFAKAGGCSFGEQPGCAYDRRGVCLCC